MVAKNVAQNACGVIINLLAVRGGEASFFKNTAKIENQPVHVAPCAPPCLLEYLTSIGLSAVGISGNLYYRTPVNLTLPGTALGARVRVSNNLQQFASLSTPALRFRFQHTRRVSVCAVLALPTNQTPQGHCKYTAPLMHSNCKGTAHI
jgi:hypothetical protein